MASPQKAPSARSPLVPGKLPPLDTGKGHGRDVEAGTDGVPEHQRVIGIASLSVMAFLCVAGGPFGIEDAVGAGGPLLVLIGCVMLPLFWGMPQALITAELSTMMDENGGYVLWVRRGLGNFWGWMSAYNHVGSNFTDLPLYATLLADYLASYLSTHGVSLSTWELWGIKLFVLVLITGFNIRGVTEVAVVSMVITFIICAPFAIEPFMPAFTENVDPSLWAKTPEHINFGVYASVMLWNFQGWDGLGCIAGEVKDAKRTYPIGVTIALVLATVSYALPVMVGIMIEPDLTQWQSGLLETIAAKIAGWLGLVVVIGSMLSNLGEFNVATCNASRAVWAMAKRKMVPPVLGWEWARYRTPVSAVLFWFVTTICLLPLNFAELVVIDTFLNNVALLLEAATFLALRHREPDTERPFKVPGGLIGAWLFTAPKFIIIIFAMGTAGLRAWLICGVANLVFAFGYMLRNRIVPKEDLTNIMDSAPPMIFVPPAVLHLDMFTEIQLDQRSPTYRAMSFDDSMLTSSPRAPSRQSRSRSHSIVSTHSHVSRASSYRSDASSLRGHGAGSGRGDGTGVSSDPRMRPIPRSAVAVTADATQTTPTLFRSGGFGAPHGAAASESGVDPLLGRRR